MSSENSKSCKKHGYDKNHHFVTARGIYSFWNKFGLLVGISVKPEKIVYTCSVCNESFDYSIDPKELKNHYL